MKSLSAPVLAVLLSSIGAGCATPKDAVPPASSPTVPVATLAPIVWPARAGDLVIASPAGTPRPPFAFSESDSAFLDEVQRAAFLYFWNAVNARTGMVPDRTSVTFTSIAGVGFQLSALPIGVERGWITRDQGDARARQILAALLANPANRHEGLFQHFLDGDTAGPRADLPEQVVSTIDTALLFAGALTAGSYFGGEVDALATRMVEAGNWRAFVAGDEAKPHERGFVSLGWSAGTKKRPAGYLPYYWVDSGDEHRLVTFMGVLAPRADFRLDPAVYYRLRRAVGDYQGTGPMVWFPFSGALFVSLFSHAWINYAAMGPDEPARFGATNRSRVDWWENSRRHVALHRLKAIQNPQGKPTLGPHAWGLSASDTAEGYGVPGVFPTLQAFVDQRPEFDYSTWAVKDDYGDGTIAPYASGAAIMFEPAAALDALRFARAQQGANGRPLVWRDPGTPGGYGFRDSYNLGTGWVAPDYVALDQGPLLLAIENARTGLIWATFQRHPLVQAAWERLGWKARAGS